MLRWFGATLLNVCRHFRFADADMDYEDDADEIIHPEVVTCLFCEEGSIPEEILRHCSNVHKCDLIGWVKRNRLPTEEIIKMINFTRATVSNSFLIQ